MRLVKAFIKKYWAAFLIFTGLGLWYYAATESGKALSYLFPKVSSIAKAFEADKGLLIPNMLSSFEIMIPSILIALLIALSLGTLLGMNKKLRDALHPVIYTFSVVPAILLAPFVLMMAPTMRVASIILIVYSTMWATLFATITGIQTIDKGYLDKAGFLYETLMANENMELARSYGVLQAPTLVLTDGKNFDKYAGAGAIKEFLDTKI